MAAPKGRPKPAGSGRQKGVTNKFSGDIRAMILSALDRAGGPDYLLEQSKSNPQAFMALVGKVCPKEVNANVAATLKVISEFPDGR